MGYTYDLTKLHAQVRDLLPPGCAFKIGFEIWDHAHGDGEVVAEVQIYDVESNTHFRGPTPDVAMALLRARYDSLTAADLGLVAVPTSD